MRSTSGTSPIVLTKAKVLTSAAGNAAARWEAAASRVAPFVTTSSTTVMRAGCSKIARTAIVSTWRCGEGLVPGAANADFSTAWVRSRHWRTVEPYPAARSASQMRSGTHSAGFWPGGNGALRGHGRA